MQRQASAALGAALQAAGPLACILRERASFELSYEDESVELLRKKVDTALVLRACHAGQLAEAEAAKAQEEEELRVWKARRPLGALVRTPSWPCRPRAAERLHRADAGWACGSGLCLLAARPWQGSGWVKAGRGGRSARAHGARV